MNLIKNLKEKIKAIIYETQKDSKHYKIWIKIIGAEDYEGRATLNIKLRFLRWKQLTFWFSNSCNSFRLII